MGIERKWWLVPAVAVGVPALWFPLHLLPLALAGVAVLILSACAGWLVHKLAESAVTRTGWIGEGEIEGNIPAEWGLHLLGIAALLLVPALVLGIPGLSGGYLAAFAKGGGYSRLMAGWLRLLDAANPFGGPVPFLLKPYLSGFGMTLFSLRIASLYGMVAGFMLARDDRTGREARARGEEAEREAERERKRVEIEEKRQRAAEEWRREEDAKRERERLEDERRKRESEDPDPWDSGFL